MGHYEELWLKNSTGPKVPYYRKKIYNKKVKEKKKSDKERRRERNKKFSSTRKKVKVCLFPWQKDQTSLDAYNRVSRSGLFYKQIMT